MPRAVILFNPVAGHGRAGELAERADALLRAGGWNVASQPTRPDTGARELARALDADVERVVVLGGDGTLRETIDGLGPRAAQVGIALVPMGNANVVARELGIPLEPEAAVEHVADDAVRPMDLARVRCTPEGASEAVVGLVLAVVGIGWDAATVGLLDRMRRSRVGRVLYRVWADGLYLIAGFANLVRRAPRLEMEVDGRRLPGVARGLHVCSLRTYAKGLWMTPDAGPDTGRLHYQARRRAAVPFLAWHLLAAWLRRRVSSVVSDYGDGTRVVVRSETPYPVQIDGDYLGRTRELEVTIIPAALRIHVPAPRDGD